MTMQFVPSYELKNLFYLEVPDELLSDPMANIQNLLILWD